MVNGDNELLIQHLSSPQTDKLQILHSSEFYFGFKMLKHVIANGICHFRDMKSEKIILKTH